MEKKMVKQESKNVRNAKIHSQILILTPPMIVYVTATQVLAETTLMELRK